MTSEGTQDDEPSRHDSCHATTLVTTATLCELRYAMFCNATRKTLLCYAAPSYATLTKLVYAIGIR